MFNTLDDLEQAVLVWSHDRGITVKGTAETQCLKLMSEVGELADNLAKGKPIDDDIGDCLVVLINIAKLKGITLLKAGNVAYKDIKDRKGFLNSNGTFIKSTDKNYEQLRIDFENTNAPVKDLIVTQVLISESPFADIYDFKLLLSDGSTYNIRLTDKFMNKYPEPPLGQTLSFWLANNDIAM